MTDPITLLTAKIDSLEARVRHLETVIKAHDKQARVIDPIHEAISACQDQLRGEMTASHVAAAAGLPDNQATLNAVSRYLDRIGTARRRTSKGRLFVFSQERQAEATPWMRRAIKFSSAALAGTMSYDQILFALKLPHPDANLDQRIRAGLESMGAVECERDIFKFPA
jgi:hypothetical protein